MARPVGPLYSVEASGQFAKAMIFSRRSSGKLVRQFHKPTGERTGPQLVQREIIAGLNAYWKVMTQGQRDVYNDIASESGEAVTGYNMFIRLACADLKTHYGLIGFWPMEEKGGGIVYDKSGEANDGVIYGEIPIVEGKIGSARQFNGVNTHIDCGQDVNPGANGTIMVWMKTTSEGERERLVSKETTNFLTEYVIYKPNESDYRFWISRGNYPGGYVNVTFGVSGLNDGSWHFLVATVDNNFVTTYTDGVKREQKPWTQGMAVSTQKTYIGASHINYVNQLYFNGVLDDVRIYNRALGLAEIKELFTQSGRY